MEKRIKRIINEISKYKKIRTKNRIVNLPNSKNNFHIFYIKATEFIPILLLLFFYISYSNQSDDYISEISIIINGTGDQQILSNETDCDGYAQFNSIPNQTFINGILQDYNGKMVYNLTKQINKITIKWN